MSRFDGSWISATVWLSTLSLLFGLLTFSIGIQPAQAEVGDYCFISTSLLPGTLDESNQCQPDEGFPVGGRVAMITSIVVMFA